MKERQGFQTAVWGPTAWVFLHSITFSYPDKPDAETRAQFFNFFKSMMYVLPCKYCRDSYASYCKSSGPLGLKMKRFESRATLTKWLYDIHDAVNLKLDKKDRPTFPEVKAIYKEFKASCTTKENERSKGCVAPNGKNGIRLKSAIRIIPRECVLKGKTLKIYRKCLERYDI